MLACPVCVQRTLLMCGRRKGETASRLAAVGPDPSLPLLRIIPATVLERCRGNWDQDQVTFSGVESILHASVLTAQLDTCANPALPSASLVSWVLGLGDRQALHGPHWVPHIRDCFEITGPISIGLSISAHRATSPTSAYQSWSRHFWMKRFSSSTGSFLRPFLWNHDAFSSAFPRGKAETFCCAATLEAGRYVNLKSGRR